MTDTSAAQIADPADVRRRRIVIAASAAVAVIVALVLWLALKGDGTKTVAAVGEPPRVVTSAELKGIAKGLKVPLYWAGPLKGARLEYTAAANGRYFVRYLTGTAAAGDGRRSFLTVGTYPGADSYKVVTSASKVATATSAKTKSGALVVNDRRSPSSVYFSFPGAAFQVEVYAPSPSRARRLVLGGTVRRVV